MFKVYAQKRGRGGRGGGMLGGEGMQVRPVRAAAGTAAVRRAIQRG